MVVAGAVALGPNTNARAECAGSRIEALESSLIAEGYRARKWRYAWGFLNESLGAGSFVILPLYAREKRPDVVVAGFGSVLSGALTLVLPLEVESTARDLERASALGPCERLRYDEGLADRYGEEEARRTGLGPHLVAIGGAAAIGGFIALAFHHGVSGLTTGLTGVLLGEGQLLTQPTRLTASHRSRMAKLFLDALPALSVSTGETGQGFVLRGSGAW